jgi:site-specific DNA recombinase
MTDVQVALYARVSSEQQAEANTIESQLSEIRARIAADGFDLGTVLEFVDEGYSGATLIRPALERLRDVAAAGGMDRLYVHCPDRFARHFAYQVVLWDEVTQRGVEVVFLNRALGQTPEDQLFLQVQGVIAEYERARVPRAESPRQTVRRPAGTCRHPVPCAIWVPVCEQAGGRRGSPL